eukprot:XP_001704937.1 Hypothetical protein GL50803_38257 [Giardia lamblia ATCC 50803]
MPRHWLEVRNPCLKERCGHCAQKWSSSDARWHGPST